MALDLDFLNAVRPLAALAVALVAFPAAHWLAMRVKKAAMASAARTGADTTLVRFLAEAARFGLLAGAAVLLLLLAGVSPASIAGGLVAVAIAVGLALQATLANVAAGILIVVQRIYRLGHFVQIGAHRGRVAVVSLFTTEIETLTGTSVTFANGEVLKQPVINFSTQPRRRFDVEVVLDWQTDTEAALRVAREAVGGLPGVLAEPAPLVEVARLTAAGPQLAVRVYCVPGDIALVSGAVPGAVHRALVAGGFAPGAVEGA